MNEDHVTIQDVAIDVEKPKIIVDIIVEKIVQIEEKIEWRVMEAEGSF